MPRTPLEAYAFDVRFGKRSVFILDPRLTLVIWASLTLATWVAVRVKVKGDAHILRVIDHWEWGCPYNYDSDTCKCCL